MKYTFIAPSQFGWTKRVASGVFVGSGGIFFLSTSHVLTLFQNSANATGLWGTAMVHRYLDGDLLATTTLLTILELLLQSPEPKTTLYNTYNRNRGIYALLRL